MTLRSAHGLARWSAHPAKAGVQQRVSVSLRVSLDSRWSLPIVTVAIGNFADPHFPAPAIAVWEESRHPWLSLPSDTPPKRVTQQG